MEIEMNVLSLFDGMSCGQVALNKAGIKYNNYYASEIDKHAISVTKKNYPNTIHLGDVRDINKESFGENKIDLLIGGSPCQGFSFAGKQLNFNDPRSVLFFEYVRLLKELNPKYFLLENVKMRKEYENVITEYLGVKPIFIDSKSLTPQTRKRLYWTNIPNITDPQQVNISFDDIIEKNLPITTKMIEYLDKFPLLKQIDDKMVHPEATKKGYAEANLHEGLDLSFPKSKTRRGRHMKNWSNCLTASSHDLGVVIKHDGKMMWRRFTPIECERLQTIPDNYTSVKDNNGIELISDSQRYKMIGNGWTADVIAHIFKNIR
jgi:DNA (cytosine-5)-methyltransferase 3A